MPQSDGIGDAHDVPLTHDGPEQLRELLRRGRRVERWQREVRGELSHQQGAPAIARQRSQQAQMREQQRLSRRLEQRMLRAQGFDNRQVQLREQPAGEHAVEAALKRVRDPLHVKLRQAQQLALGSVHPAPLRQAAQHTADIERRVAPHFRARFGLEPRQRAAERLDVEIDELDAFINGREPSQIQVVAVPRTQHAERRQGRGSRRCRRCGAGSRALQEQPHDVRAVRRKPLPLIRRRAIRLLLKRYRRAQRRICVNLHRAVAAQRFALRCSLGARA